MPRVHSIRLCVSSLAVLLLATANSGFGQTDYVPPLAERDAFDRITLNAENGNARIDVFPIEKIDRTQRITAPPNITIRRIQDPPEQRYSVNAQHITKIELFPYILFDEARRLVAGGKVDAAFPLLARLKVEYPGTTGLTQLTEDFFYKDAGVLFQSRRFDEALQSLDEVYRLNPLRASKALDSVLSRIIQTEYKAGNFQSVRNKIDFTRKKYGTATPKTLDKWEARLKQNATAELTAARAALDSGNPTRAMASIRSARAIWPDLKGIDALNRTILQRYPRVRVAVTQQYRGSSEFEPATWSLNWATRRVTPIVQRELVAFRDFTADGGEYESRVGQLKVDATRSKVTLTLRPEFSGATHLLSRSLLTMANPENPSFSPRWAEFLSSVYVPGTNTLEIELTRPTLRPIGLLPRTDTVSLPGGQFQRSAESGEEQQTFQIVNENDSEIREISETYFDDPTAATQAILTGEVEVIDRVFPPDVERLSKTPSVRVSEYRLPTIHGLVFNDREPLVRDSTFRRGILYGINRAGFLANDINSPGRQHGQVLTGFAPIGNTPSDPLGYAYDREIKPREYDPALAVVLMRLAIQQRAILANPDETVTDESPDEAEEENSEAGEEAEDTEDDPNSLPELVLAFADSPIAKAACSQISSDLRRLGMTIKLRQLEPGEGRPRDENWDMLYVETTMEEPLVDIPNLILGHSLLGRFGGLVWQETRRLQEASELSEVRERFMRIHKLTFDHTPMIPLWQVIEHAAIAKSVSGIDSQPNGIISLYGNVPDWRLGQ